MRRPSCNRLPAISRPAAARAKVPEYIDTALVKPRAPLSPSETVKRMADDMRAASYREGGITEDDLERLGFTRSQIKAHAADARALAHQLAGPSL
ncbi:hypothetical protein HAP47_0021200 [Bradyrhizobium sp. 41S5]|uniref:hypothetical protein n=1 Tax=Bradyrhizobium sp. 41S5 TaxID=1404443 RepID=UPI00156A9D29|nr:hypothetical protein [Bradyrhizobium sp. 41S5]UFX41824.1 hypothetical protein HAP47_0021200 [Bradyrhizobium sp. 41S5]